MPAELCPVRWLDQHAVITLPDEIDISNADQVGSELLAVIGGATTAVIADLSATTFCDSAGVSALIGAFRRAAAGGAELRLVISHYPVLRILAIMGVDRLIGIYPDVPAALAGRREPKQPGAARPEPGGGPLPGHGGFMPWTAADPEPLT